MTNNTFGTYRDKLPENPLPKYSTARRCLVKAYHEMDEYIVEKDGLPPSLMPFTSRRRCISMGNKVTISNASIVQKASPSYTVRQEKHLIRADDQYALCYG